MLLRRAVQGAGDPQRRDRRRVGLGVELLDGDPAPGCIEAKAEADSGAKHGTISARKSLLPGATELEDIIKHSAAMRTWWNTVSAPWFG